jgi:Ca2+-binding RTX toxin-like protein
VYAGTGNDTVYGYSGNDYIYGEAGDDTLYGDWSSTSTISGNDTIYGGTGNDKIYGGYGDDILWGDDGNDQVAGGYGNDYLEGNKGKDILKGNEGNDVLVGGKQADILIGGTGSDRFVFAAIDASGLGALNRDQIRKTDPGSLSPAVAFEFGDKIDVSGIDANAGVFGNQAFKFGGQISATATGKTGFLYVTNVGADTIVRMNTDADKAWESEIEIEDGTQLASWYDAGDFFL